MEAALSPRVAPSPATRVDRALPLASPPSPPTRAASPASARGELPAATGPGPASRLLVVHAGASGFAHHTLSDLPALLRPGDLVVVNDAATLPSSLRGHTGGREVELRLADHVGGDRWRVAVLGAGDWRTPTERRPPPPPLLPGDEVELGAQLRAVVAEVGHRWAVVDLRGPRGWLDGVLRAGEPVRYAYLGSAVPLSAFQTAWASRPWASESPSAGLPLRMETLLALRRAGIGLAVLTHAAGLSSIDGGEVDAGLPWCERSDIPAETVAAVEATRAAGGRVIAVGTTVVRALEGRAADRARLDAAAEADSPEPTSAAAERAVHRERLVPGVDRTCLRLGPGSPLRVVSGVLTKLHEPGESHFELLRAFAPRELLVRAHRDAARRGYQAHEFGDSALVLP